MVRVFVTALVMFLALPATAQQLTLDIRDGLVTLQATNVPVRQVLAEWAKVGGTKVIGGERLGGAPLTLSLQGVPEAKALDIVLRGAAGYMAAARVVPGTGRSGYDRILVLATSTPPAGGSSPATAAGGRPTPPRPFGVPPAVEAPETSDVGDDMPAQMNDAPQVNPFANAFGQPGVVPQFGQPPQQGANPFGQPVPQNPFGQAVPQNQFGQPLQPGQGLFVPVPPQQPQTAPPPGLFGVVGSPTPGVVQQAPAQPGVRPRPQG
jgi:hypothetical protein